MKTKQFSFKELKDFVLSQKDERKIDMSDSGAEDCGCILVQFFRNKTKNKVLSVGYITADVFKEKEIIGYFANSDDEEKIHNYIRKCLFSQTTRYKEAKEILKTFN